LKKAEPCAAPAQGLTRFRVELEKKRLPIAEGDPSTPLEKWTGRSQDERRKVGKHVVWTLPHGFTLRDLDFHYYLPVLLTGLAETAEPYTFLAEMAVRDLISFGGKHCRLLTVVDKCVLPLKACIASSNPAVVQRGLKTLQHLMICDLEYSGDAQVTVGLSMRRHFRLLLPVLSVTRNVMTSKNTPQTLEAAAQVVNTLEVLEQHGGIGVTREIKLNFPDYVSSLAPSEIASQEKELALQRAQQELAGGGPPYNKTIDAGSEAFATKALETQERPVPSHMVGESPEPGAAP